MICSYAREANLAGQQCGKDKSAGAVIKKLFIDCDRSPPVLIHIL